MQDVTFQEYLCRQPVRQCYLPDCALAALLLEQGHVQAARAVYVQDLERWPDNIWALHGLQQTVTE